MIILNCCVTVVVEFVAVGVVVKFVAVTFVVDLLTVIEQNCHHLLAGQT